MKFGKKTLAIVLALVMCASMVAPAFAASFNDLRDAIDGASTGEELSEGIFGYGKNEDGTYGIEAWNDRDDDGNEIRNVHLNDDVKREDGDQPVAIVGADKNIVLDLDGHTIDGNNSDRSVIDIGYDATLTINGADEEGNKGVITGGNSGLFISGTATIKDVEIAGNESVTSGGGVYVAGGSTVVLDNVDIHDNFAAENGGGVNADVNSVVTIKDSEIHDNEAGIAGGGIYASMGTTVNVEESSIKDNEAAYGGGIGVTWDANLNVEGSEISNNDASDLGGGIYGYYGNISVEEDSTVANNGAGKAGDDVYVYGGKLSLLEAEAMDATLEADEKQITGWYYDAGGRWSKDPNYPYGEMGTEYDNNIVALKAAHDQYFNVIYKNGVGEDDGVVLKETEVENGSAIPGIENQPTREGYEFAGWLLSDNSEVDFVNGVVNSNLVLVAQWNEVDPGPGTDPDPELPDPDPELPDPEVEIDDEEIPLASAVGLNDTDHMAYIIGYEDDTVRPLAEITRAEVATIFFRLMTDLYRTINWSTTNDFSDVNEGAWYNNAVSTCASAEIVSGYADGTFKPGQAITRAEFAVIVARFLSGEYTGEGVEDFADTVGHWAAEDIRRCVEAGWITTGEENFRPEDHITRAEVMTIINRMLHRTPDEDHMIPEMKTWIDNPKGTDYYEAVQEATNEHDYERDEEEIETWTELLELRDWKDLEAQWAEEMAEG